MKTLGLTPAKALTCVINGDDPLDFCIDWWRNKCAAPDGRPVRGDPSIDPTHPASLAMTVLNNARDVVRRSERGLRLEAAARLAGVGSDVVAYWRAAAGQLEATIDRFEKETVPRAKAAVDAAVRSAASRSNVNPKGQQHPGPIRFCSRASCVAIEAKWTRTWTVLDWMRHVANLEARLCAEAAQLRRCLAKLDELADDIREEWESRPQITTAIIALDRLHPIRNERPGDQANETDSGVPG
jgi:hypothetical protein